MVVSKESTRIRPQNNRVNYGIQLLTVRANKAAKVGEYLNGTIWKNIDDHVQQDEDIQNSVERHSDLCCSNKGGHKKQNKEQKTF